MKHFFKSFSWKDYIFFLTCAIAYFFLIRQYIPVLDDFRYHYCYHDWPQPIRSFSDILKSQAYHYTHVNGRFIVHCFVQYFCGFGGLLAYYVGSSLMFVFLIANATLLIKRDVPSEMRELGSARYLFPLLLLLFVPQVGIFFFGSVAFTVNYMWSTAVYLGFLLIYFRVKDNPQDWKRGECLLLALAGVLCGSWQESFSICVAGALVIYYVFHLKEVRGALWWLLVGFAIGVMIGVFAPGNFARIASPQDMSRHLGIYDITQMLKHNLFFQSLVVVTIGSVVVDIRRRQPLFVCRNWLYYISVAISLLFAACIAYHDLYQLTIIQVFSVILTIKFLYGYCYPILLRRWDNYLAITLVVLMLLIYIPSLHLRRIASKGYKEAESSILTARDGIAYDTRLEYLHYGLLPSYHLWADYVNSVYFQTLYTEPSLLSLRLTGDATPLYECILPDSMDSIKTMCIDENNQIADSIFISPNRTYLIVRVNKSEQEKEYTLVESTIAAAPVARLKDKLKKRVYKEYRYPLQPGQTIRKFTYEDYSYFIIPIQQVTGRTVEQRWLEAF